MADAGSTPGAPPASEAAALLAQLVRRPLEALVADARAQLVAQVRSLRGLADLVGDTLGSAAPPVAGLAGDAASTIDRIADTLESRSVDELVNDGRALVRAQPVAAVAVAVAIGFLAGRMVQAARD
jgi:ElaB/YqjD/DUF883 family membrane-anchored ribosome-binding protein